MNNRISCLLCLTCFLLQGCGMMSSRVVSNTTAFYQGGYSARGAIMVIAADKTINNSLEFAYYKGKFEQKLTSYGYQVVRDSNKAEYIALVAYGIDNGETSNVSTPIFGQTSGGTTYTSGTVYGSSGVGNYSSTSYTMPTYGVIGSSSSSQTTYQRAIALDIVQADSYKTGKPKRVYEGRTKSSGSCSVIVEVFDEMLEAMFHEYPGENGRNHVLRVESDANC